MGRLKFKDALAEALETGDRYALESVVYGYRRFRKGKFREYMADKIMRDTYIEMLKKNISYPAEITMRDRRYWQGRRKKRGWKR